MPEHHRYSVFGLIVASEIALPELDVSSGDAPADVRIALGSFPIRESEGTGLKIFPDGALLNIPEAGRYWMSGGQELIVEPRIGASEANVRLYLLGSAFAAILHQRSLLPLHANAVIVGGKAIGFMGHPGAGKSTLAAWFHDNDHEVLADDVFIATSILGSRPVAQPGIPRLRLWREALELSGRDASHYERSFDDMDKFTVPTQDRLRAGPAELSHLYLLQKPDSSGAGGIRRLGAVDAIQALVANTYRGAYVPLMGKTQEHLFACVQLAKEVPVFSASRQWGFDTFDDEASKLAEHARQTIRSRDMLR
jgi:hypothetical protein